MSTTPDEMLGSGSRVLMGCGMVELILCAIAHGVKAELLRDAIGKLGKGERPRTNGR
jgi:hypothetical protein